MSGKFIGILLALTLGFLGAKEIDQNDGVLPLMAYIVISCAIAWILPFVLLRQPHPTKPYTLALLAGVVVWVVLLRMHGT
jgi:hypothetical protein